MKRKQITIIAICSAVVLLTCFILAANTLLTNLVAASNIVCVGQKFLSAEDAIIAMETEQRELNDTSLDNCPPYEVVYTFDYEENTIVFYSYCYSYDGNPSTSFAVRVLKHNDDGTLSFDSGFADFILREPDGTENYYYFTNIHTSGGIKSISFLYLPSNSEKHIYIDGIRTEKVLVSIENHEFYLCYAISNPDTFLSNHFTAISDRHEIEIR